MSIAKTKEKNRARYLRQEKGMTIGKISETLGVSKSSVSNWVKGITFTEEQRKALKDNQRKCISKAGVTRADTFRQRRLVFQGAGAEQAKKMEPLHFAGCKIYWGEGSKEKN